VRCWRDGYYLATTLAGMSTAALGHGGHFSPQILPWGLAVIRLHQQSTVADTSLVTTFLIYTTGGALFVVLVFIALVAARVTMRE
jgi:hypothetical protein